MKSKLQIVNKPDQEDVDGFLTAVSAYAADQQDFHLADIQRFGEMIEYSDKSTAWSAFAKKYGVGDIVVTTHLAD